MFYDFRTAFSSNLGLDPDPPKIIQVRIRKHTASIQL